MRKRFALTASVLTLVLIVAGACASASTAANSGTAAVSDGATFPVSIMVDNGLSGLQAITVSITRESGGRRLLGPVESGKKRTFSYDASTGAYQLIARRGAGNEDIVSDMFRVEQTGTITWRLPSNVLIQE